jgi:hypothetical protein
MTRKEKIPKALREAVWVKHMGKRFEHKCLTPWCSNRINVFDFHVSYGIPESKGGATVIENLYPLCARCNQSMGSTHTVDSWNKFKQERPWYVCC